MKKLDHKEQVLRVDSARQLHAEHQGGPSRSCCTWGKVSGDETAGWCRSAVEPSVLLKEARPVDAEQDQGRYRQI